LAGQLDPGVGRPVSEANKGLHLYHPTDALEYPAAASGKTPNAPGQPGSAYK